MNNKVVIPAETWVELYAVLSNHILEYSSLDNIWIVDENGNEVRTEDKQNEFCEIVDEVETILEAFFIKEEAWKKKDLKLGVQTLWTLIYLNIFLIANKMPKIT